MPSHPPRAAIAAANLRALSASTTWLAGTVTYAGTEYADVPVSLGALQPYTTPDGASAWLQPLQVSLPKHRRADAPVAKKLVTYQGQDYAIESVSGHRPTEAAWRLQCVRYTR